MRRVQGFVTIFFLIFNLIVFSQNQFDTLSIKQVAKGVQHYSIEESNIPWTLDVLKIDLHESIIKVEAGISRDQIKGFEKTSAMSNRSNYDGHHIVGAINGGFFDGTGRDVRMQIREGEIVTPDVNRSAIGFTFNKEPFIEVLTLQSNLILKNKTTKVINGINSTRYENALILYNSYFGSSTLTNQYGSEIIIEPIADIMVNDTTICVVTSKVSDQGNTTLSKGKMVLSGHGTSKDYINSNINIGDTIFVMNKISPAPDKVTALLTGFPKIVSNGINCALACYAAEGGSSSFATSRHPRTAAGFSQDKRYLYFVTVDGRQESSKGMSLPELADFLVGIGVYRAVNLDGGGSTTMVVRDQIVNSPSDGSGERSVANSLMIVSLDPGGDLVRINLNSDYEEVFAELNYQFSVTGSDEYYNSTPIENSNVQYSLSHNFGTITNEGLFTAGEKIDSGYVIAEYNNMVDSAYVRVNSIARIEITPRIVFADTTNEIQFNVHSFDMNGLDQNLANNYFNWVSTNSSIGIVDSNGVFYGLSPGTTKIIVVWGGISDTAVVSIEFKEGTMLLNKFDNIDEWTLSGKNIDTSSSSIEIISETYSEGNSSLKLNYNFTFQSGIQNWAYLSTEIPIEGIPKNFELDVNVNDYNHSIALVVSNYSGDEFALLSNGVVDIDEHFDTLNFTFDGPIPLGSNNIFHFPVILKQIAVILGSDRENNITYEGSILFDNLRVNYSEVKVFVRDTEELANSFTLFQNYPNPFNPTTRIEYKIPHTPKNEISKVSLTVFDILGRNIATLIDKYQSAGNYTITFDASKFASGVYYYTLRVGDFTASKKMLLLR